MSDTPTPIVELVRAPAQELYQPVMTIETAIARRDNIVQFVKRIMVQDQDFGVIPGTNSKPVLLKPGAEKLCNFFGLEPAFTPITEDADWTGEHHNGEPFYYIRYRCTLTRNGVVMGVGEGSCNSWESKYRWRESKRVCPACGKDAIIKGREEYGGGWLCFAKKGGCGAKYPDKDKAIIDQPTGRVPNPDVADQVNTIQKMAQKRALVPATLLATSGSEFFTQDLEDAPEPPPAPAPFPESKATAERRFDKAEQTRRASKETRGEGPTPGAEDSPAPTHVASPAHSAPEVPAPLKALFDNLNKPGYIKQAFSLLKNRLVEISPNAGPGEYDRIVRAHDLTAGTQMEGYKAALLDMWNVADEWQRQATETTEATQGSLL